MRFLRRRPKRIALIVVLLFVSVFVGALVYYGTPSGELMPEALAALESGARVQVGRSNWITFMPLAQQPSAGFIFIPVEGSPPKPMRHWDETLPKRVI